MSENKRAWDFLNEDQRRTFVKEIIGYFATERNEEIGVVAAENILDFFLQNAGNTIYNRAIEDVKTFLEKDFGYTIINLDVSLRKKE